MQRKQFWYQSIPFDPTLVIAAIEAGAEVIVVAAGDEAAVRRLGKVRVLSEHGDLQWGRDVARLAIRADRPEPRAVGPLANVIGCADWSIIPLENLIAQLGRKGALIQTVTAAEQARVALSVMERGADGVLLVSNDRNEIKRVGTIVAQIASPVLELLPVAIEKITAVAMGDRCCIDTASLLAPGEGLLVGNTAEAQFLVHNENVAAPYIRPRPFRVNAGAVHAYVRLPGDRVGYLSELASGAEVLVVAPDGASRIVIVGRNKIERRPLLQVIARAEDGRPVSLIMQNAETIRLTTPVGQPISVTKLQPGDCVLAHCSKPVGRHLGQAIEETIFEQ